MIKVNIRNLVIQADLNTGKKEEVGSLIDAINNLLSEHFPNEQPQIMSSGLDDSDVETQRNHEDITGDRMGQIAHIQDYIRTMTEGSIKLFERGEKMKLTGMINVTDFRDGDTVQMIDEEGVYIEESDWHIDFEKLHDNDVYELYEMIERLQTDDEKTQKRIED